MFARYVTHRQQGALGMNSGVRGFLSVVMAAALVACTTVSAETRLSSALIASEFNEVGSQYMDRPTFVSVQSFSDGATALKVLMDEYGGGYDPRLKMTTEHVTYFDKRFVADYLPLIDKYAEWEALAVTRGDLIDREVGRARTWGNGADVDLRFNLHSASAERHLLVIERCALGTCLDKALHLTKDNAAILRALLVDFAAGKVTQQNVDSIYK